jgi:DNA-binding NarL/FixJ family response regulator
MIKKANNIIITEPSEIIFEGILSILINTGLQFHIHRADNLHEMEQLHLKTKAEIILINPLLVQNQLKYFQTLKKESHGSKWIAIVYSYTDAQILTLFDDIVNINDSRNKLIESVKRLLRPANKPQLQKQQTDLLSEREIEVLKLLVSGNANKEIANKMNISTHTVISHRKNISQKTGIKTVSGLTIYAVINKIISVDNYNE